MSERVIKFRIWDSQLKLFLYMMPIPIHFEWPRFTVEQFTGLEDKNGVGIYENSIVSAKISDESFEFAKRSYERSVSTSPIFSRDFSENIPRVGVIFFSRGSYYIGKTYLWNVATLLNQYDSGELEIIGNVHENPELLDKEEK